MIELQTVYSDIANKNEHPYIEPTINILSTRFKQYLSHEIYILALFFWPRYRDFAVSKFVNYDKILQMVGKLFVAWSYGQKTGLKIIKELEESYFHMHFSDIEQNRVARVFWSLVPGFSTETRSFISILYKIKGHGAPVESLFSKLSYIKPKFKNKMTQENMKMLGIIDNELKLSCPSKNTGKKRKTDGLQPVENVSTNNMTLQDMTEDECVTNFLDEFEELLNDYDDLDLNDLEAGIDIGHISSGMS